MTQCRAVVIMPSMVEVRSVLFLCAALCIDRKKKAENTTMFSACFIIFHLEEKMPF